MALFRHILLATDGSAASQSAGRLAVDLAREHGAQLTVVFVVDPYPYLGVGDTNPAGLNAYLSAAHEQAAAAHADVIALCNEEGRTPVPVEAELLEDVTAARGIVQSALTLGADLVVVGSHGRTGLARAMLGSVAANVAATSPVPVLIARQAH